MKNNTMYPPQYETVIRFGTRVEQLCMWINRRATRQAGGDGGKRRLTPPAAAGT